MEFWSCLMIIFVVTLLTSWTSATLNTDSGSLPPLDCSRSRNQHKLTIKTSLDSFYLCLLMTFDLVVKVGWEPSTSSGCFFLPFSLLFPVESTGIRMYVLLFS